MNCEHPDVQDGFRKVEEPEIKLPTFVRSLKKQVSSRKHLLHWLCQNLWLCRSQQTVENSSRVGLPDHLTCLLRNLYAVKKQQLELKMKQQIGSKSGKEHAKAVYCHPAYLTYMQSTSYKMLGWMKHKPQSILLGEISITSDDTTFMAESK